MRGGHKGKAVFHSFLQKSADKAWNSRMRMNNIYLFLFDNFFQNEIGARHFQHISLVQRHMVMANPCLCQLLFVNAAVGGNNNIIALLFQLLGKLHHMGFRPADFQPHQSHQNFILFHVLTPTHSLMLVIFITGFAYFVATFISEFAFISTTPSTK